MLRNFSLLKAKSIKDCHQSKIGGKFLTFCAFSRLCRQNHAKLATSQRLDGKF
ncbi:MAG: hypothetical protein V1740_05465 [Candidatus Woesearchaeota archaeon]